MSEKNCIIAEFLLRPLIFSRVFAAEKEANVIRNASTYKSNTSTVTTLLCTGCPRTKYTGFCVGVLL